MSLAQCSAQQVLDGEDRFDALIDVRSPAEFAEDHLPGAVNWPVLDDAERARVGTIYTQVSTFEARKLGAALVSRRIADTLERHVAGQPRDWRPLVYCWRGGQRSGSLSLVLAQIGFRTTQLSGGYKAFRARVRDELDAWPARFEWQVLSGRTGSGKTRLLQSLNAAGAQTLDLEALACHRGSVLGGLPDRAQPSQKHFETQLWQALRGLDPARPVYVESESRRIGARQVPDALLAAMRETGRLVRIEMSLAGRCALLLQDYAFFTQDVDALCARLATLTELRGKATVARWQTQARSGQWQAMLTELLQQHYDPLYDHSTPGHFQAHEHALVLALDTGDAAALAAAAARLLR